MKVFYVKIGGRKKKVFLDNYFRVNYVVTHQV